MRQAQRSRRIFVLGTAVVTVSAVVLVMIVAFVLNQRCVDDFWSEAWVYPDAETVASESAFLGAQQRVLFTPDSVTEVEEWYRLEIVQRQRESVTSGDFSQVNFREPSSIMPAANGSGTEITFSGQCP